MFIKAEKTKKIDPSPRAIQPRSPRYNIELGCFIRAIEHRVYAAVDAHCAHDRHLVFPTIMKGKNLVERGKIASGKGGSFFDPVYVSIDVSRFDQSVSAPLLAEVEHPVYLRYFTGADANFLKTLLSWQIDNVGFAGEHFQYGVHGCRMSGDMNTALGNCLLMTLMCKAFATDLRVPMEIMNDGDDCVLIFERVHLDNVRNKVADYFLQFGMRVVIDKIAHTLEEMEFCQCHPVYIPLHGGYVMVRNPVKCLAGDASGFGSFCDGEAKARQTLRAIGLCGGFLVRGLPMLQPFYASLRAASPNSVQLDDPNAISATGFLIHAKMLAGAEGVRLSTLREYQLITPIHPDTRVSFHKAFGIDPNYQRLVEERYSGFKILPGIEHRGPVLCYDRGQCIRCIHDDIGDWSCL
jgi:hypothetical protein